MPKFTAGSGGGFPILPDGDYDFTIVEAILKKTEKGSDMIEVRLSIEWNGEFYRVYENLVFSEKAEWKVEQLLKSLGDTLLPGEEINVEPADIIGREGRCSIVSGVYNGKSRNKVASFLEPDELLGLEK